MESPYQQQQHYMRPPPPPAPPSMGPDPNYPTQYQQHHPPQTNPWYPAQFQYHPSPSPPPQQNQWGPPQQQQHPYPSHPYPPPYPNQDWGNANWAHPTSWEHPGAHSNEDDWAARARAWADNQQSQPQPLYSSAPREEDPSHYANQYPPPVESHYQDVQQPSVPTSGYMSYQGPAASMYRPPVGPPPEPPSVSSYASESHFSFPAKDGVVHGDMSAGFSHHQGQPSSSNHQPEVPSSYSSVPGKEDGFHGKQHGNVFPPADGRSVPADHPQFAYGNHLLNPMDQPLVFSSRFSHESDPKMASSYPDSSVPVRGTDAAAAVSSLQSWTPLSGVSYPQISPGFPSAPQHDPVGLPQLPGQPSSLYGTGLGFQPPVPSIATHVGLSAGSALHPAAAFPADVYGGPLSSERPKKAAVPKWLTEELFKSKATIGSSAPEHFKEESQSVEDELTDTPTEKGDQADSKSMDPARSEEDEDDEDEEDVHRTAAINQEIKRVLTDVLLKVTDELFDEIATKVLSEDDPTSNAVAEPDAHIHVPKVSPPPSVPAPKASAKVLIPVKAKESEDHASGETSSGSPGNVLGLANYTSDDDDDDDGSAAKPGSSAVRGSSENDHLQLEAEGHKNALVNAEAHHSNGSSLGTYAEHGVPSSRLINARVSKDLDNIDSSGVYSTSTMSADKKSGGNHDAAKSVDIGHNGTLNGPDLPAEKYDLSKSSRDDSQERGSKRHDRHESKRRSSRRDKYKETESSKEREVEKDDIHSRRDERHKKKEKTEDSKREKEKDKKERSPYRGEKARESDYRKRSPHREGKDSKYDRERDKRRSSKDEGHKKRERTKEERDEMSRHKSTDTGRHKRRRSSSVDSQGKPSKENPIISDGSSDDVSEKVHSKRRNMSPSPVRSRRRQVSRSPHSKHTQRRHSPYSSLEDSRGRKSRSRSRSPVRRHR